MDNERNPLQDSSVKEIQEIEAPITEKSRSGLAAIKHFLHQKVSSIPGPPKESWSGDSQPCSEGRTIAAMNDTLDDITKLLTSIMDQLRSISKKEGDIDDGTA